MNSIVYVITHKKCNRPSLDGYKLLAVGSKGKKFPDDYVRDDVGDNISEYNNSYCELTGLYWIWKNDKSQNVGLVHYRRFFVNVEKTLKFKGRYVFWNTKKYSIMSIDELERELIGYDVLIKMSDKKSISNEQLFEQFLGTEIWNELNDVIRLQEEKYKASFKNLCKEKQHVNCNMFYGKKYIINRYCEWVFGILDGVDQIHLKKYEKRYNNREMGYLAELLFGVWLDAEGILYKELPVINVGDDYAMDGALNIIQFIRFMIIKPLNHIFGCNIK